MADDSIVKFCARVGPRSVCLVIANFPPDGRGQDHVTSYQERQLLQTHHYGVVKYVCWHQSKALHWCPIFLISITLDAV